jgi:TonB-linked SusC/RagA family outer membrane protein
MPLQGKEISISVKKSSLPKILYEISEKSGITIYFVNADLSMYNDITYEAKNKEVKNILADLLKDKDLQFEIISEKQIGIRKIKLKSIDSAELSDTLVTVSGTVTNEKGDPLPGATIKVKNKNTGATADVNGNFLIKDISPKSVLVLSNISYVTQEVRITGKSKLGNIQLKPLVGIIDDVQVIAYGISSRRYLTGNIASIKSRDIELQPVNNPILALQGRVPGIFIESLNGLPGSEIKVRIQGQNSMLSGNMPFYVIDGVPYAASSFPSITGVLGAASPLSQINPQDIESIEILKDADATSIYGSRAANGAILITTKKGKSGQTNVSIDFQKGYGKVTRRMRLLNTEEYLEMRQEAFRNDNRIIGPGDHDLNGEWEKNRYTNWQDVLIGGTAHFYQASGSVRGGSDISQYLFSGTYQKQTSVMPGDFANQKGSLHFNFNGSSTNKKFNCNLSGNFQIDNNKLISGDLTSSAINLPPNAPRLFTDKGDLNWEPDAEGNSTFENPLAPQYNPFTGKTITMILGGGLGYRPLAGLEIKSTFGYNYIQNNETLLVYSKSYRPEWLQYYTGLARYGTNNQASWILEPQVTYRGTIGNGTIDLLVGATFSKLKNTGEQLTGQGYSSELLLDDIKSAATIIAEQSIFSQYNYSALFARFNYSLRDKYVLNLTMRRDGSSRFGSENLFHNFGSVGGAWLFSNERFMKAASSFLTFGKIRMSYGTTGNDQIGDYFFMSLYSPIAASRRYQNATGLQTDRLTNPYLQWEETKKLQGGLDLAFWKNKLSLTINVYKNRSSNQLLYSPLPYTTGFAYSARNFPATVQNSGLEVSIGTTLVENKNVTWTSNINLTVPKNKLVTFPIELEAFNSSYVLNQSINTQRKYKLSGVDPQTGKYIFFTEKGDLTFQPSDNDRTVLFNPDPTFYGGINNTIKLWNFSLDFLISFVKQRDVGYKYGVQLPGSRNNNAESTRDRWQKVGDVKTVQRYNSDYTIAEPWYFTLNSDAVISDASYVRLKNVALSWTLPDSWMRSLKIKTSRLFAHAQNLVTVSRYSGLDPETRGLSLPPLRLFTFGVHIEI